MIYYEKYGLYIDNDLVIYYWNKRLDKLMQSSICKNNSGYLMVNTKINTKYVHRIIYETFIGEIPDEYEIDHINTIRTDNRLENLRCCTCKENNNNPLTKIKRSESHKGKLLSKETKRKISEEHKGKSLSEETKRKISKRHKGKLLSETTRKKMSDTHIGMSMKPRSDFGKKYKEHYGIRCSDNLKQYHREHEYYRTHHKCSWE